MTTTWYVGVPVVLAALAGVAVLVKPSLLHWRLSPTTPDTPGDDDREASGEPVEHEGATEEYGDKLRAMRKVENSPDLIRPSEQMLADHEALHAISTALDDFDRTVSDAISRFLRNQPTVLLRLPSSIEHTGELPVVEMAAAS